MVVVVVVRSWVWVQTVVAVVVEAVQHQDRCSTFDTSGHALSQEQMNPLVAWSRSHQGRPTRAAKKEASRGLIPAREGTRLIHTHLQRLGVNRIELSIDAAGSGYHIALRITLQRHCNQLLVRESLHDAATSAADAAA